MREIVAGLILAQTSGPPQPASAVIESFAIWSQVLLFLLSVVVTVAVTFYLKDYLRDRREYSKFKSKLEKIAGKGATVLYGPNPPMGTQEFRIIEVDQQGVTLQNELHTIFLPAAKLLSSEIIIPCDNYEAAKLAKMKRDMEQISEAIMPAMLEKMFPILKDAMERHLLEDLLEESGDFSAVIGVKIQRVLKEEGYELKKLAAKKE